MCSKNIYRANFLVLNTIVKKKLYIYIINIRLNFKPNYFHVKRELWLVNLAKIPKIYTLTEV